MLYHPVKVPSMSFTLSLDFSSAHCESEFELKYEIENSKTNRNFHIKRIRNYYRLNFRKENLQTWKNIVKNKAPRTPHDFNFQNVIWTNEGKSKKLVSNNPLKENVDIWSIFNIYVCIVGKNPWKYVEKLLM